jgi:hypothetical protein
MGNTAALGHAPIPLILSPAQRAAASKAPATLGPTPTLDQCPACVQRTGVLPPREPDHLRYHLAMINRCMYATHSDEKLDESLAAHSYLRHSNG